MLLEKYTPASTKRIVGNRNQVNKIKELLAAGEHIVVCGPPGCGKTLAIRLAAKELGYALFESHASDERGRKNIEDIINVSKQHSVFSKKKIVLIEEADTIESKKLLLDLIDESKHPVVFVVNDPYAVSQITKRCKLVRFSKIPEYDILRFLNYVRSNERVACSDDIIKEIAKASSGDLRAALIDLEMLHPQAERGKYSNIFETVSAVFKEDPKISRQMLDISQINVLFAWVGENIPKECKDAEEIAAAYDYLSKADIFRSRIIRRQSWNMQKYFIDLMIYGIRAAKKSDRPVLRYNPPRMMKKFTNTLEKIANNLHVSRKKAVSYINVMTALVDDESFRNKLDLDESDVEFIKNY